MATHLTAEGKFPFIGSGEVILSKFDVVIPKTPLYKGIVV